MDLENPFQAQMRFMPIFYSGTFASTFTILNDISINNVKAPNTAPVMNILLKRQPIPEANIFQCETEEIFIFRN